MHRKRPLASRRVKRRTNWTFLRVKSRQSGFVKSLCRFGASEGVRVDAETAKPVKELELEARFSCHDETVDRGAWGFPSFSILHRLVQGIIVCCLCSHPSGTAEGSCFLSLSMQCRNWSCVNSCLGNRHLRVQAAPPVFAQCISCTFGFVRVWAFQCRWDKVSILGDFCVLVFLSFTDSDHFRGRGCTLSSVLVGNRTCTLNPYVHGNRFATKSKP